MIKAIVFDLDGVYFENGTKVFKDTILKRFSISENEFSSVYFSSSKMQDYKKGKIDGNIFWN